MSREFFERFWRSVKPDNVCHIVHIASLLKCFQTVNEILLLLGVLSNDMECCDKYKNYQWYYFHELIFLKAFTSARAKTFW